MYVYKNEFLILLDFTVRLSRWTQENAYGEGIILPKCKAQMEGVGQRKLKNRTEPGGQDTDQI